jgi:hypothetical protein
MHKPRNTQQMSTTELFQGNQLEQSMSAKTDLQRRSVTLTRQCRNKPRNTHK